MLKVMIAEDDLLIADMMEEVLVEGGYSVCGIGRTVAEMGALAKKHKPDLAILDVRLADGGQGTDIAAGLTNLPRLGILYVTGNVAAVMHDGICGHACLLKPYRAVDLLRGLEIVAEMVGTGTATQTFPPGFQILPGAAALANLPPRDGMKTRGLPRP
jgi:DNA-binding response OmpR family regulator